MSKNFDYAAVVGSPKNQSNPIPGKDMVENSCGAYVFQIDEFKMLDRFLIMGTCSDTYYAKAKELTRNAAKTVEKAIGIDGRRVVDRIREVSVEGLAPRQDPVIFSLVLCVISGNADTKSYALKALPDICRTATHLFTFVHYLDTMGGWSRSVRRAVGNWYNSRPADRLAYQMIKYRGRNDWTHKDVLRLSHPKAVSEGHDTLYQWAVGKGDGSGMKLVEVYNEMQTIDYNNTSGLKRACSLIRDHRLPFEVVPKHHLDDRNIWDALLDDMPMTALIRNIATMTRNGLITTGSDAAKRVVSQLGDVERLRKSRIHPIQILSALRIYTRGYGSGSKFRSGTDWSPVSSVVDALDDAFYAAFKNVEPTGKSINLSLDVSGSMTVGEVAGMAGLTPRDVSAAMALVTANVENDYEIYGFDHKYRPLDISPKRRLDDVITYMNCLSFGSTDCSLPMRFAIEKNKQYDAFCVYTDSETNAYGSNHPSVSLHQYRSHSGIDAKLIVLAMVVNDFSIADPNDGGMLDIVGFGSDTPQLMSRFIKGEF